MNTNSEIVLRDACTVKANIDKFLNAFHPKQSDETIKTVYETAIESIDRFKAQFPSELKLLRDVVIPKPFPDLTIFTEIADKIENKPQSVYIPTASDILTVVRKNIVIINAKPWFQGEVEKQLDKIESTSVGKRLIEKIGKLSHTAYIMKGDSDASKSHDVLKASVRGVGSSCTITLTHNFHRYLGSDFKEHPFPQFIVLAHELIHAYHDMQGKAHPDLNIDKCIWGNSEEWYTINGLPSKNQIRVIPKISESALLQETGRLTRITYFSPPVDALLYARLKIVAELFQRASQSFTPSQKICPPIVVITHKELEPSTFIVRIFSSLSHHKFIYTKVNECEETFVWRDIPIAELTPKICGPHAKDLRWVSDYRISLIETAAIMSY